MFCPSSIEKLSIGLLCVWSQIGIIESSLMLYTGGVVVVVY